MQEESNSISLTNNYTKLNEASSELDKLFTALSKAQAEIKPALKDKDNPFFKSKYADLESCWEAIRQPFTSNGLSVIQLPQEGYQSVKLKTLLCHSSGQYIASVTELKPSKQDPQGTGSALTYARRYGLMAICGIAPEDDDGNEASQKKEAKVTSTRTVENHAPTYRGGVSEAQLKRLHVLSKEYGWPPENVSTVLKDKFKLDSAKQLNSKQYNELCELIQNHTL